MDLRHKKIKRVVPWFSMFEWDDVYKLVFSDNLKSQEKGYQRLLVWKARQKELPALVECTLVLLQVHLHDKQMQNKDVNNLNGIFNEEDLKLMYSSAITRFINHLSALFQDISKETLFKMAVKLHIPSWVVALRHDCAHGNTLPCISVFRAATRFALDWLHEQCWKSETLGMSDWEPTEENVIVLDDDDESVHVFRKLLDLWESLKVYSEAGCFKFFEEIPDEEVSETYKQLFKRKCKNKEEKYSDCEVFDSKSLDSEDEGNGTIEHSSDENDIVSVLNNMMTNGGDLLDGDFPDDSDESIGSMSIRDALKQIIVRLKKFFNESTDSKIDQLNAVIYDIVLQGKLFLQDPQYYGQDLNTLKTVPDRLVKFWKDFLKIINSDVISFLLEKLITLTSDINESDYRRKMAALWIKNLCLSLVKVSKVLRLIEKRNLEESGDKMLSIAPNILVKVQKEGKVTVKSILKKMFAQVSKEDVRLANVPILRVEASLKNSTVMKLLFSAAKSPNEYSSVFLLSLAELVEPPLPESSKTNLLSLISIYRGENVPVSDLQLLTFDGPAYTVEDIMTNRETLETGVSSMETDVISVNENIEKVITSRWTRDVETDWRKYPIGVLPSQRNFPYMNFEIPNSVQWIMSDVAVSKLQSCRNFPQFVHENIDWENIQKKRLRNKRKVDMLNAECEQDTIVLINKGLLQGNSKQDSTHTRKKMFLLQNTPGIKC